MRAEEVADRAGKQADGSAKTREAKLVTIWTAESCDEEGKPVRDPGSITDSAAVESASALDTSPDLSDFATRVFREATRRGFSEAARPVILGDGSAWIWNTAGELFPQATQILDAFSRVARDKVCGIESQAVLLICRLRRVPSCVVSGSFWPSC